MSEVNYFLTEEQQMIVDLARQITRDKIIPVRARLDETEEFPWDIMKDLAQADLVFFKGDLNYRKLVGDRDWDPTTSFSISLQGFHPAPLCSLRALKADTVVGLRPGLAEEVALRDEKWQVNGNWATISFCGERLS